MIITTFFWLIGVFIIVLQTALLHGLPVWVGRPDFLFILFVFFAYRFAWIPGIILVFSLSWIMDVVMSLQLGFYPLVCLSVFAILKMISAGSLIKESTYQIPLLGISYLASQFVLYIIYSMVLDAVLPDWQWEQNVQNACILMIVAIPMLIICNKLYFSLLSRKQRPRTPRRTMKRQYSFNSSL